MLSLAVVLADNSGKGDSLYPDTKTERMGVLHQRVLVHWVWGMNMSLF